MINLRAAGAVRAMAATDSLVFHFFILLRFLIKAFSNSNMLNM